MPKIPTMKKMGALALFKVGCHLLLSRLRPFFEHVAVILIYAAAVVFVLKFTEDTKIDNLLRCFLLGFVFHLNLVFLAAFYPRTFRWLVSLYTEFISEFEGD